MCVVSKYKIEVILIIIYHLTVNVQLKKKKKTKKKALGFCSFLIDGFEFDPKEF